MKVYIKQQNNQFSNSMHFIAYLGFDKMGYEIEFYEDIKTVDNTLEDIVIGYVGDVRKALDKFNIKYPELNYPESIKKYLGREIWESTINKIASNPDFWNVFIKPKQTKIFTGFVVNSTKDLIQCCDIDKNTSVFCSEVLDIVAEWRCFILNNEIIDVRKYRGDYKTGLYDWKIIDNILSDYTDQPSAFCLDVGLTSDEKLF